MNKLLNLLKASLEFSKANQAEALKAVSQLFYELTPHAEPCPNTIQQRVIRVIKAGKPIAVSTTLIKEIVGCDSKLPVDDIVNAEIERLQALNKINSINNEGWAMA